MGSFFGYGFHISRSNNSFRKIINFSKKYNCSVIQFFLKSSLSNFDLIDINEFKQVNEYVKNNDIFLVAHCSLNLAKNYSNNLNEIYFFVLDMHKAHNLGAKGVILHAGNVSQKGCSFDNIKLNLDYILNNMPLGLKLILENTLGSKGDVGFDFIGLNKIYNLLDDDQKRRVEFCLDTCHFHVSGYDLSNSNFKDDIKNHLGLENIFCIHLNDSKNKFNSKLDGHREIGFGNIEESILKNIAIFAKENNIPIIMETTEKENSYDKQILKIVGWLG